jgi:hypothetical protein
VEELTSVMDAMSGMLHGMVADDTVEDEEGSEELLQGYTMGKQSEDGYTLQDKLKATVRAMGPMLMHVLRKRADAVGRCTLNSVDP